METKTENPPPQEGDPEPAENREIPFLYNTLADRAPSIIWAPEWSIWVYKGDIPLSQFPSLPAYLDEFPFQVEVTDECVVVTDPGFGNGAIEWVFRGFRLESGNWFGVLTETDMHQETSECKLWIGQWQDGEWIELTDFGLPAISRADFFGPEADPQILEDFELVSLQYVLPKSGDTLQIQAMPNAEFQCFDGKISHPDLAEDAARYICEAWQSFKPQPVQCKFDRHEGRFLRQAN